MIDKKFGFRLQQLRKKRDLTQEQVARGIGISYGSLQHHEGGYIPNQNNVQKYVDFYQCNKLWLLHGEGEPFPDKGEEDLPLVREEKGVYSTGEKLGGISDPMIQAIAGVKEIFDTRNAVLVQAITLNIAVFQMAARNETKTLDQEKRIAALENRLERLTDQIRDLRNNLTSPDTAAAIVSKKT